MHTSDIAEIWYVGSIWVPGGRAMIAEIKMADAPNVQFLNRYNSAADCPISLKFGRVRSHDTRCIANVQGQRVKG